MGKRNRYRDHIDPEHQRWGRTYPRFPGVAECARLIRDGKARGSWADIISYELAENAAKCLAELVEAFRTDPSDSVRLYVMMALDIARLPESVPFLAEVLQEGNPLFTPFALRALNGIDTRGVAHRVVASDAWSAASVAIDSTSNIGGDRRITNRCT